MTFLCGHVHAWDDRTFAGVRYVTLPAMSERNTPEPGEHLVRITVGTDGVPRLSRVMMHYTPK